MEARPRPTSAPSLNPPSVEIAYKRKCIALKKRLAEVEAENELMRTRNRRGWQYIQKMRLESCMLLERLAKVTGMTEEAQAGAADPELRARAVAMMSSVASMNGLGGGASGHNGPSLEDETEGSSDEQPPTPEDRPLRIKRSRKSNAAGEQGEQGEDDNQGQDNAAESADRDPAALPRLAPAPSQQDLTSSFRVQAGSGAEGEETPAAASTHSQDNREGQSEQPAEGAEPADSGTTPMDMDTDTKEPKVEQ